MKSGITQNSSHVPFGDQQCNGEKSHIQLLDLWQWNTVHRHTHYTVDKFGLNIYIETIHKVWMSERWRKTLSNTSNAVVAFSILLHLTRNIDHLVCFKNFLHAINTKKKSIEI